jgi:hypothetical protein
MNLNLSEENALISLFSLILPLGWPPLLYVEHRTMTKAVVPNLGKSSPRGRWSTRLGFLINPSFEKQGKLLNEITLGQKETDNVRQMIKIS